MVPSNIIALFDEFLGEQDLSLEAVLVGGAALAPLGVITRETRDCDVLHPELPEAITTASVAFAEKQRANGDELDDEWLNNGPAQLTIDRADCLALAPSAGELAEATPWLHLQDGHPGWPAHVDSTLSELREALQHGL